MRVAFVKMHGLGNDFVVIDRRVGNVPPVDTALADLRRRIGSDPTELALFGGEDFGLLFAVPPRASAAVKRLAGRFALRRIGVLTEGSGVALARNGLLEALPDRGFDHFGGKNGR